MPTPQQTPEVAAVSGVQDDIGRICERAKAHVMAQVLDHVQRYPQSPFNGEPLLKLEKAIAAAYGQWGQDLDGEFRESLPRICQIAYDRAANELRTAGLRRAIIGEPDAGRIKYFLESCFKQVALRTDKMSIAHIGELRQLSADIFRRSSLTGESWQKVSRQLMNRAAMVPGFRFVDVAGRTWKDRTYFEMLATTELMKAGRESYEDKCVGEGYDVMLLTVSGHPCRYCALYEGRLFSLTGATPGLPTKADLVAAKVFHPRCTHTYSAVPDVIRELDYDASGKPLH